MYGVRMYKDTNAHTYKNVKVILFLCRGYLSSGLERKAKRIHTIETLAKLGKASKFESKNAGALRFYFKLQHESEAAVRFFFCVFTPAVI